MANKAYKYVNGIANNCLKRKFQLKEFFDLLIHTEEDLLIDLLVFRQLVHLDHRQDQASVVLMEKNPLLF